MGIPNNISKIAIGVLVGGIIAWVAVEATHSTRVSHDLASLKTGDVIDRLSDDLKKIAEAKNKTTTDTTNPPALAEKELADLFASCTRARDSSAEYVPDLLPAYQQARGALISECVNFGNVAAARPLTTQDLATAAFNLSMVTRRAFETEFPDEVRKTETSQQQVVRDVKSMAQWGAAPALPR